MSSVCNLPSLHNLHGAWCELDRWFPVPLSAQNEFWVPLCWSSAASDAARRYFIHVSLIDDVTSRGKCTHPYRSPRKQGLAASRNVSRVFVRACKAMTEAAKRVVGTGSKVGKCMCACVCVDVVCVCVFMRFYSSGCMLASMSGAGWTNIYNYYLFYFESIKFFKICLLWTGGVKSESCHRFH